MKFKRLFRIEKILISCIILTIIGLAIMKVFSTATLSSSNIQLEKIKRKISKQESINQSLVMSINELASLSNIQAIAKDYGLNYNNDNILIIKDN